MSYRAIYNPVIHQVQGPVVYDLEGCLSIPGCVCPFLLPEYGVC